MKTFIFLFSCMLGTAFINAASAQTQTVKQLTISSPAATSAPASSSSEVKPAGDIQVIDGRKVNVDSNGVQSLSVPEEKDAKKEETHTPE